MDTVDSDGFISRIPLPARNDLRLLPDGETGGALILFTQEGDAFIPLVTKEPGPDRVWKRDGVWYGELAGPNTPSRMTGYRSLAAAGDDVAPVLLRKTDPNLKFRPWP